MGSVGTGFTKWRPFEDWAQVDDSSKAFDGERGRGRTNLVLLTSPDLYSIESTPVVTYRYRMNSLYLGRGTGTQTNKYPYTSRKLETHSDLTSICGHGLETISCRNTFIHFVLPACDKLCVIQCIVPESGIEYTYYLALIVCLMCLYCLHMLWFRHVKGLDPRS